MEPDVVTCLKQRVLPEHGGRKEDSWDHHWNLTNGDSQLHARAADEIERLRGERKVLDQLLTKAVRFIETVDPEDAHEGEFLAALVSQIKAVLLSGAPDNSGPRSMELFSDHQSTSKGS